MIIPAGETYVGESAEVVSFRSEFPGIKGLESMGKGRNRMTHERFDGEGYPRGLKGHLIPLGARIIAVADTFSALLQNRPYRSGTSLEAALTEIRRCAGTQFDPAVVLALEAMHRELPSFFFRQIDRRDSAAPVQGTPACH